MVLRFSAVLHHHGSHSPATDIIRRSDRDRAVTAFGIDQRGAAHHSRYSIRQVLALHFRQLAWQGRLIPIAEFGVCTLASHRDWLPMSAFDGTSVEF